jgi:hypothetical protein
MKNTRNYFLTSKKIANESKLKAPCTPPKHPSIFEKQYN